MNNSQNKKTVNEAGVLPAIISDTEAFKEMTRKERTAFYGLINDTISALEKDKPKIKEMELTRSQDLYKAMCLYPEKRLNQAFLKNKFKDEKKWHFYVSILEFCLYEHLVSSLDSFQANHKELTVEMKRAETRINEMKAQVEKYETSKS